MLSEGPEPRWKRTKSDVLDVANVAGGRGIFKRTHDIRIILVVWFFETFSWQIAKAIIYGRLLRQFLAVHPLWLLELVLLFLGFYNIWVRFQKIYNILFDFKIADFELLAILRKFNIGLSNFSVIAEAFHVHRIIIFVTLNSDRLHLVFQNLEQLLVFPIELKAYFISQKFLTLLIKRSFKCIV